MKETLEGGLNGQPIVEAPPFEIRAVIAQRVTFASHQNDVAVIYDLSICNNTDQNMDNLVLEIVSDPPVLGGRQWSIDRSLAGGEVAIHDLKISLEGGILHHLNEAMKSEIRLTLKQGEDILAEHTVPLDALARNEWGGGRYMPELLAAFVMPNDPAVSRLLKEAANILESAGREPSINGYQSKSRERVWELASAIWAAVSARGITYAVAPKGFERRGQKVRVPSEIESTGLANCLDATLLFTAALEQAGLRPIVVFTEGHAFSGVWLQPQNLPSMTVEDAMELRKAIALNELILFETTLATQNPPIPFKKAIESGSNHIAEEHEDEFVYAIDIARARNQIRPLSFAPKKSTEGGSDLTSEPSVTLPPLELDTPPSLPPVDADAADADGDEPATPVERLERWKRSLLDLSTRNRLLNLKKGPTAIPIFCPDPAKLEDDIAGGKSIKVIIPPPRDKPEEGIDPTLRKLRTGNNLDVQFAQNALSRHEIVANTDKKSLENGLVSLYRKTNSDFAEGGANTLFLALGTLRWNRLNDSRTCRAPLILLPVKLERKSARSKPRLKSHDDDPVFNLTLIEMLRQDFEIDLHGLAGDLPTDASGIDVKGIWDTVRAKIHEVSGFEVVEEVVLSNFSFAKYLMWKDLSDRTDELKQSPFVKHLIDTPREPYESGVRFMNPNEIDEKIDPKELLAPLHADSSQIVAIHASALGGDFVLEGPPGTGKSETIGNIIAHNIGMGRRVLFVSEKMAALEVVHDRLRRIGLGDFCLELHSAKAQKKAVIEQLGAAWEVRSEDSNREWDGTAEGLLKARSGLNELVAELHAPGPAGISPKTAIGRLLRFDEEHPIDLGWPKDLSAGHASTPEAHAQLVETTHSLQIAFTQLTDDDLEAFGGIKQENWSNAWQTETVDVAQQLDGATQEFKAARDGLISQLGLSPANSSVDEARALAVLAGYVPQITELNCGFAVTADAKKIMEVILEAMVELKAYRGLQFELKIAYADEHIKEKEIGEFISAWDAAEQKFWLFKLFAHSALRKAIRVHFGLSKQECKTPEADLERLRDMAAGRGRMEKLVGDISSNVPWKGLKTDFQETQKALEVGNEIRERVVRFSSFGRDLAETRSCLTKCFDEGGGVLEPDIPLRQVCDELIKVEATFTATFKKFTNLIDNAEKLDLDEITKATAGIRERAPRLNVWCAWVEARHKADSAGLGKLSEALTTGIIAPENATDAFKTAYCHWAAPLLIDSRELLRRFSSASHEDLIKTFRDLDKALAEATPERIRTLLSGKVPTKEDARSEQGYGVLVRELQKRMHHKPVRQLISEMGESFTTLTPCLMMSPLSVAQFLPPGQALFDLVVFDEASQITVPDAIGAIARGKNCIIVGDPKQMPPTRFFERGAEDNAYEDQNDLESILDEALSARVPHHRLTGHYRSKHESLIRFSNRYYYGGKLVTFPASDTRETVVTMRRVKDGVYDKGESRTNRIEAEAVVSEVVDRLRDPRRNKLSIGIVTFNSDQQRLIEDLLDHERRGEPELERFFGGGTEKSVFVKNLETVQGNQRDVILLSVGYGPTESGGETMSMNFGPLNRDGGERRLNVAITRATTEIVVFASFDPSMIDLQRTSATAVRDFKHYLDFADRGSVALGEAILSDGGLDSYDSDFEEFVASGLRRKGWTVRTQVGVSKFRIDLGIVHPDAPGRFLAGVECDGATYHSSPSARDRDRIRQIILEQLGWTMRRVWSTDFFNDRQGRLDRLHEDLEKLLETDRKNHEDSSGDSMPGAAPADEQFL